jgi:hypothetical protein
MNARRVNRLLRASLVRDLQCSCYCESCRSADSPADSKAKKHVWRVRTGNGRKCSGYPNPNFSERLEVKNSMLGAKIGRPSM